MLESEMGEVLRTRTAVEWAEIFDRHDIPNAAVLDIGEALSQAVVADRGLVRKVAHPTAGEICVVGSPLKFSEPFADSEVLPSPALGEHTAEILSELLGYDGDKVAKLASDNVIRL